LTRSGPGRGDGSGAGGGGGLLSLTLPRRKRRFLLMIALCAPSMPRRREARRWAHGPGRHRLRCVARNRRTQYKERCARFTLYLWGSRDGTKVNSPTRLYLRRLFSGTNSSGPGKIMGSLLRGGIGRVVTNDQRDTMPSL
jgi:hypothetical protein